MRGEARCTVKSFDAGVLYPTPNTCCVEKPGFSMEANFRELPAQADPCQNDLPRWLWINTYLIPFLGGRTSINPSYFDVNYRGIGFWPIPRSSKNWANWANLQNDFWIFWSALEWRCSTLMTQRQVGSKRSICTMMALSPVGPWDFADSCEFKNGGSLGLSPFFATDQWSFWSKVEQAILDSRGFKWFRCDSFISSITHRIHVCYIW